MKRTLVIGVALAIVAFVMPFSTFSSASVCARCGCRSCAIDFQLPLIPLTYWRNRTVEMTQFSAMAKELSLCGSHTHEWRFIHGGGNGVLCAIGSGSNLDRNVRSGEVVAFITNTDRFRSKAEAQRWFKTALDDRDSKALIDWLQWYSFPENGFDDIAGYEDWRQRTDKEWPEMLEINNR